MDGCASRWMDGGNVLVVDYSTGAVVVAVLLLLLLWR